MNHWVFSLPPSVHLEHLLALVVAFVVGALATLVVRAVAPRVDFVSRPKGERWSMAPTPLGGGVAMFVGIAPGLWLLSPDLLLGATIVHLLGLIDDKRNLSPPVKLVFQTVAACVVVAAPFGGGSVLGPDGTPGLANLPQALAPLGPALIAIPVTIAFYVGVANSTNLLDNMDGSAAGVGAVSAAFIYLLATGGHAPDPVLGAAAAITAGAALGFLTQNFPPAKIFMGDAGSLLLGFTLAGLALRIPAAAAASDSPVQRLAVMVFVIGAPLFDTALVWVTRKSANRPFLQGGRDHTTHRLMALGLSPRRTLIVIYGVAAVLGGVALAVSRGGVGVAVTASVAGGALLVLLGVFLGDVPVYKTAEGALVPTQARSPALLYAVELIVDIAALSACWLAAYAIRFDGEDLTFYLRASALPALPVVIGAKVLVLLLFGLYRGFWRTIRFRDVSKIAQAVFVSSVLVVVVATVTTRFENYSRGVFLIDGLLSLGAIVASRSAMRLFRDTLGRLMDHTRRAVLIGPEALRDLVTTGAGDERLTLVGVIVPDASSTPDAVVARARELTAEVVLIAPPVTETDPQVVALRTAGLEVRRVRAIFE